MGETIYHGDERDGRHGIKNAGGAPLKTLNARVPPAYTDEGDESPAGKSA